jgi:hypothetical protein
MIQVNQLSDFGLNKVTDSVADVFVAVLLLEFATLDDY